MSNYKDIMDFIGERVDISKDLLYGVGWKYAQLKYERANGTIDYVAALAFRDRLGQFIAEAINEKMQRERGLHSDECKHEQVIMIRHAYKCKQCNKVID